MTAALAGGAAAEPVAAKVTFSGIGDVRLGMAEADVRSEMGRPTTTRLSRNRGAVVLHYRRRKLDVTIDSGQSRVVGVRTRSRAQRTRSGLGVGSTKTEVRRKLRGEKCATALRVLVCTVERSGAIMDFELRRDKVTRVTVTRATAG
jgi:hypothetical protein